MLWRAVLTAAPAGAVIWILANVSIDGVSLATRISDALDPLGWAIGLDGVILLVDVFLSDRQRWITYALSLLSIVGAAFVTLQSGVEARISAFDGTFVADPLGDLLKLFAYGTVAVAFMYSHDYLRRRGLFKGEYFVLGLTALLGIMVMISAGSLITVYIGVELLSLSL